MCRLFISHFLMIIFALLPLSPEAHQLSTAYFSAELNESGGLNGQLQIRLYDLERSVGLDKDQNAQLTWAETLVQTVPVQQYLQTVMHLSRDAKPCTISFEGTWQIDSHFNENYLVLPLRAQCSVQGNIGIDYSGFFTEDSEHKLLLNIVSASRNYSRVITSDNRNIQLNVGNGNNWATFKEFVYQGIIHIWIGLDHILFLICLLLACVLGLKVSESNIRSTIWQVLGIVTAFTLAHSLTLTAVTLHWIQVPSRWVELGIALTVLASALNNIFPLVTRLAWVTFGFGLLHGMGFAGVLGELGLPGDRQLLTVLAFNVGVELGQAAIILLVLPLLFAIKASNVNLRYCLNGASCLIALVAIQWIIQRMPVI